MDVFSKNEHTQVPLLDRSAPFVNDIAVSKDGVIKLLKGLNPSKALCTLQVTRTHSMFKYHGSS